MLKDLYHLSVLLDESYDYVMSLDPKQFNEVNNKKNRNKRNT